MRTALLRKNKNPTLPGCLATRRSWVFVVYGLEVSGDSPIKPPDHSLFLRVDGKTPTTGGKTSKMMGLSCIRWTISRYFGFIWFDFEFKSRNSTYSTRE
ncbi:hypothetical protein [Ammoniphilus sp. 3BR4]|uniref:hypothetical protein n=1 Tax=Ammoniphilus sp. 3BR4 TaxID=3158265 RepID=UPI003467A3E1